MVFESTEKELFHASPQHGETVTAKNIESFKKNMKMM